MEFIVEVPVYIRTRIFAATPEQAASAASDLVDSGIEVGQIVPLDPDEDREPDVYICRGGKLGYVTESGDLEPTGDDCDLPTDP